MRGIVDVGGGNRDAFGAGVFDYPFILITASVFLPAVQTALLMCPDREAEIWSFIQNIICPENQLIR